MRANVLLRHSSLTEQAARKVDNWLTGARDQTSVVQALCRLDTHVDVTSTFRQATQTSKKFFKDGDPDETDGMLSGEDLDGEEWPDADELGYIDLNEQNDVGYDCAEEENIWTWHSSLTKTHR